MASKIFISYRQSDSAHVAGRIYDRLSREFDRASLFRDVDTLRLGADFARELRERVASCDVLMAIIGPKWLHESDETGGRRLDDPNDYVRIEIGTALQRDIRVIPILVEDTRPPKADELPQDLAELPNRQGIHVRNDSFDANIATLIRELRSGRQPAPSQAQLPFLADLSYPLAALGLAILFLVCSYTGVLPPQDVLLERLRSTLQSGSAAWLTAISAIESTVAFNVYFPGALVILAAMAATAGHPNLTLLVFAAITSGQMIGYLVDYWIGYYFGRSVAPAGRSLKFNSRYVTIDWPVPPWVLIFATFCHPHSAALTSYNLGTQVFSPLLFIIWAVVGTLVWGLFWTFVCLSGANVIIKNTPWGPVFVVYVAIWLAWIYLRRQRARKPSFALGR